MIRNPKFDGRCEGLKGHVFKYGDPSQANIYIKTKREIAEYVGRTYQQDGSIIKQSIDNLTTYTIPEPVDYDPKTATELEKLKWNKAYDLFLKKKERIEDNFKRTYTLIWGQCSEPLRTRIEGHSEYSQVSNDYDPVGLLTIIRNLVFNYQAQKHPCHAVHDAKRKFFMHSMVSTKMSDSPQKYYESFNNVVDTINTTKADIGVDESIAIYYAKTEDGITDITTLDPTQKLALKKKAKERYLATAFILGADRSRYGRLIEEMENSFIKGKDEYPTTLTDAYNLLVYWRQNPRYMSPGMQGSDGVSFANVGGTDTTGRGGGRGGSRGGRGASRNVKCFNCGENHYASNCPNKDEHSTNVNAGSEGTTTDGDNNANVNANVSNPTANNTNNTELDGTQMLLAGITEGEDFLSGYQFMNGGEVEETADPYRNFQFLQGNGNNKPSKLPDSWILLDNQSTIDVFYNGAMLRNIHVVPSTMRIHCNAGVARTNQVGELPGYGMVWYHPDGIANILSLRNVKRHYRITYDSETDNCFVVHKMNGTNRIFRESDRGLYFYDAAEGADYNTGTVLVETVAANKSKYTQRDYSHAVLARKLQAIIGRPSLKQFKKILDTGLLPNCPLTSQDAMAAEYIFGKDLGSIKGKTTRQQPEHVPIQHVSLPVELMARYKDVILAGDIMYVNKIPFFVTISRNLKFGTTERLHTQTGDVLFKCLKQVVGHYHQRGFRVTDVLMDGQFEPLRGDLATLGINLNIAANDEHVPEVERRIRTLKERARCVFNTLPFRQLPAAIAVEIVHYANFWLNCFPHDDGISDKISPREIMTNTKLDYNKHCRLEFGAYVQTHEDHDNSMDARTIGAIALRPTGNAQGGYYFFNLMTGKIVRRSHWTSLPMPADVIDRIHSWARRSAADKGLIFAYRNGDAIPDPDDDDDDDSYHPDPTFTLDDEYADDADLAGVDYEQEPVPLFHNPIQQYMAGANPIYIEDPANEPYKAPQDPPEEAEDADDALGENDEQPDIDPIGNQPENQVEADINNQEEEQIAQEAEEEPQQTIPLTGRRPAIA